MLAVIGQGTLAPLTLTRINTRRKDGNYVLLHFSRKQTGVAHVTLDQGAERLWFGVELVFVPYGVPRTVRKKKGGSGTSCCARALDSSRGKSGVVGSVHVQPCYPCLFHSSCG